MKMINTKIHDSYNPPEFIKKRKLLRFRVHFIRWVGHLAKTEKNCSALKASVD